MKRKKNMSCYMLSALLTASFTTGSAQTEAEIKADVPLPGLHTTNDLDLDEHGITGGLAVHLNGGYAAAVTEAISQNEAFVVQEFVPDMKRLDAARGAIRDTGTYGRVTAHLLDGADLPFVDRAVNVVAVSGTGWNIPDEEIQRVLAPGGVWLTLDDAGKVIEQWNKPWTETLDDWSHYIGVLEFFIDRPLNTCDTTGKSSLKSFPRRKGFEST